MIRITITNMPELDYNMVTDLEFINVENYSELERRTIIEKYKELDSEFLDPFQMADAKNYISQILEIDKQDLELYLEYANTCIGNC